MSRLILRWSGIRLLRQQNSLFPFSPGSQRAVAEKLQAVESRETIKEVSSSTPEMFPSLVHHVFGRHPQPCPAAARRSWNPVSTGIVTAESQAADANGEDLLLPKRYLFPKIFLRLRCKMSPTAIISPPPLYGGVGPQLPPTSQALGGSWRLSDGFSRLFDRPIHFALD